MIHVVIGGSGSGKSEYAEKLAQGLKQGNHALYYIATMYPYSGEGETVDEETKRRIERHRSMRGEKGFRTIEQYTDIAGVWRTEADGQTSNCSCGDTYLLECMSNLLANEMYLRHGLLSSNQGFRLTDREKVQALAKTCILKPLVERSAKGDFLVVVTNDVHSHGAQEIYDESTQVYIDVLGFINCELAKAADRVTEVCCGIPVPIKGTGNQEV